MQEIRKANRGISAEKQVYYFGINFPGRFTHGALLVAECLADYYRTGELTVTEYVGKKYNPVDHHIKEFVVTPADLKILLDELKNVQNPEHELYESWIKEETRQQFYVLVVLYFVFLICDGKRGKINFLKKKYRKNNEK